MTHLGFPPLLVKRLLLSETREGIRKVPVQINTIVVEPERDRYKLFINQTWAIRQLLGKSNNNQKFSKWHLKHPYMLPRVEKLIFHTKVRITVVMSTWPESFYTIDETNSCWINISPVIWKRVAGHWTPHCLHCPCHKRSQVSVPIVHILSPGNWGGLCQKGHWSYNLCQINLRNLIICYGNT